MRILSIGNSFSVDAQRYLHRLAKRDGVSLKTCNLYIGGCSLRTHYLNMLEDKAAYEFCFNGEGTGLPVSIKQALMSDEWDIVTLQQVSTKSTSFETYVPYIERLAEYVRTYCPHAKLYVHQTWAYEAESDRLKLTAGYETPRAMFDALSEAYEMAAQLIGADGIIPSGRAMINATEMGIGKIHRDTFHASYGAGRYLLALTWYRALLGKDISGNDYDDFDEPVSEKEREIAIAAVNAAF